MRFAIILSVMLGVWGCEELDPFPGTQPGGGGAGGTVLLLDMGAGGEGGDTDAGQGGQGGEGGEGGEGGQGAAGGGGPPGIDGRALYFRYCAVCHGPDGTGALAWPDSIRGMTDTFEVINQGRGEMPAFPDLTRDEVLAIEAFLSDPTVEPGPEPGPEAPEPDVTPPDPLTPLEFYATQCAACHGPRGEGTARGTQIRYPVREYATWIVRNGRQGWGYGHAMPAYRVDQIDEAGLLEIFAWLSTEPRPSTGQALYRTFCGNCHGTTERPGWVDEDLAGEPLYEHFEVVREGEGGRAYWDREEYMPAWSPAELSDAEIQQIWAYIIATFEPEDDDDDDDDDYEEYGPGKR